MEMVLDFQGSYLWLVAAIIATFSLWMLYQVDWYLLLSDVVQQRVFTCSVVGLFLLWQLHGELEAQHLRFHLLGISAIVLLLDVYLAIAAGVFAMLIYALVHSIGVQLYLLNLLWIVITPALVTAFLLKIEKKLGSPIFFSYIFVCAFFGGALAMLANIITLSLFTTAYGESLWGHHAVNAVPYSMLFMFSEAITNGMVITALTVFAPQLLTTLDEHRYGGHQ